MNLKNKRKVSMRKKKINKIDRMLELPQEVYTNVPKVVITGFDEMIICGLYPSIL